MGNAEYMGLISRVSSRTYRYYFLSRTILEAKNKPNMSDTIDSLRATLKAAGHERKIKKGLNEECRDLDKHNAVVCFLANDVKEDNYKRLVEALASNANVPLVKVDSSATLGEMCGLCKVDEDGEVSKVVKVGSCVINDWPATGGEAVNQFKAQIASM